MKISNSDITSQFGKPVYECSSYYDAESRIDNVKRFYIRKTKDNNNEYIDEVTWDDLDMDEMFLRINHTESFVGEQTLYYRLHKIFSEYNCEANIQKLGNKDTRERYQQWLHNIGKQKESFYLIDFIKTIDLFKLPFEKLIPLMQIFLLFFLLIFIFTKNLIILACFILNAFINLIFYLNIKSKYTDHIESVRTIKYIIDFMTFVKKDNVIDIPSNIETSFNDLNELKKPIYLYASIKKKTVIGELLSIFMDYVFGVTLLDLALFNKITNLISKYTKEIEDIFEFIGNIDSDISILSYRLSIHKYCIPVFNDNNGINFEDLDHPLLYNPVSNSFCLNKKAIITGNNASGKSTYMKAIALNVILAQTINTCIASAATLPKTYVMTCMALTDDIETGESYYFREAKYIKSMLDLISNYNSMNIQTLIIIDEILKGTNTMERISASKAILNYLVKYDCFAIVATHDIELSENKNYEKYYFDCNIVDDDISFDYIIKKGVCTTTNAIALLGLLEYPEEIINESKKHFAQM